MVASIRPLFPSGPLANLTGCGSSAGANGRDGANRRASALLALPLLGLLLPR